MIVITGATGQLGSRVLTHLLSLVPASSLVATARDPSKLADVGAKGVKVLSADYDDPASLRAAFTGADKLLLVSSNVPALDASVAQHIRAIDAAKSAGVKHVFYTSHAAAAHDSAFMPAIVHARTEDALEGSGMQYTSLRNAFYMTSIAHFIAGVKYSGTIQAPPNGPVAWVHHDDLALATAKILAGDETWDKHVFLTNSEALDFAGIAKAATAAWGREIKYDEVTPQQQKEAIMSHGQPEFMADFLLGMYAAAANGEFARVDPTLERLVGKKPISVEEWLKTQAE